MPVPDPPELTQYELELAAGFYELSAHRPWNMDSPMAIPYSEITAWLDEHAMRGEERDRWIQAIRAMDRRWRAELAEKRRFERQE